MNIRQEIALSLKCGLPVPDFRVQGTIEPTEEINLLSAPEWELREDVIFWSPDNTVAQLYYFNGQYLQHPLIIIDDPYLLSGRQGAKLESNLVTMFPGELKINKYTPAISEYLASIEYKGYITLVFSMGKDGLMYNRIMLELPEGYLQNILNLYNLSEDWFIADLSNNSLPAPSGISVSLKLYAYPYYPDNNMAVVDNIPVPGAYLS